MALLNQKSSLSVMALLLTATTVDVAHAGGARRQTASQMMRLGGPTTIVTTSNRGFVDRTGGPSLRTDADVRRFFETQQLERSRR